MFGHQSNQQDQHNDDQANLPNDAAAAAPAQVTPTDSTWQHPGAPLDDNPTDNSISEAGGDAGLADDHTAPTVAPPATDYHSDDQVDEQHDDHIDDHDQPAADAGTDDLVDIKRQALNQLSPLVGHLDQTSEEKFRTTMMMIQASDNQSLIPTAYGAAQQIGDEKARAQALLDVINEINYFTQQPSK